MGFYPIDYAYVSKAFLPATVHLVFFIAIVKILTASTNRDYFFVKLIAFMELLAACVLSSSINFFVFLALFLLLGVATFASSEIRRSAQKLASPRAPTRGVSLRLASATVCVSTGILILTGALFFLLPRTARAAFLLPPAAWRWPHAQPPAATRWNSLKIHRTPVPKIQWRNAARPGNLPP